MSGIQWSMRKLPDGDYAGMITLVPSADCPATAMQKGKPVRLVAKSKTKAGALAKAAAVADTLLNNPLLKAALPPGSGAAIAAIKALATSAAAGKLAKTAKKYVGKGAKRLYKALTSFW